MSKVTIETKITAKYLRGKTKEEVIDHVMRLLDENDNLRSRLKDADSALRLSHEAMVHPINAWKGNVERTALDAVRHYRTAYGSEEAS